MVPVCDAWLSLIPDRLPAGRVECHRRRRAGRRILYPGQPALHCDMAALRRSRNHLNAESTQGGLSRINVTSLIWASALRQGKKRRCEIAGQKCRAGLLAALMINFFGRCWRSTCCRYCPDSHQNVRENVVSLMAQRKICLPGRRADDFAPKRSVEHQYSTVMPSFYGQHHEALPSSLSRRQKRVTVLL